MNRAGPISPRKSALAIRVARHLSLDADEEAALDMLEGVPQKLTPGEPLLTAGDPVVSLFVVQQGWLHLSNRLPDGTRQILRFHYPGDLIGTSSIPWHHAGATLTAVATASSRRCARPIWAGCSRGTAGSAASSMPWRRRSRWRWATG